MGLTEQFNALSEDSFNALLELSKDQAILLLDRSGKIISCNKNAEKITGYSMQEMYGLPFFVLYRNDTSETDYLSTLEFAQKKGAYINKEFCKRKDGTSFLVIINLTALPNEKNESINFILILDTPSESNKITGTMHLAGVIERTADAIFSTDLQFKIISWNKAAEKLFGYSREEVTGMLLKDIVKPNLTKEIFQGIDSDIKQHGFWIGDVVHTNRDGRTLEIRESITVTKDKGNTVDGYLWICRDMTSAKKNERQLLQMARLIENTNDAIYLTSSSNIILSWNKAAEEMYGYKAADVLNKPADEILQLQILPDIRTEIGKTITEKGYWKGEVNHKRKDGTVFPVLVSVIAARNLEGDIQEFLFLCTDVTDIKNAEKRKSEKKLLKEKELSDSIINSLPGIFYLFDSNGKFLRWNKQFETVSGYSYKELSQMTPDMFFEGEDKILVGDKIKLVFTGRIC
jgi:PAS domain S-box-containing protein